MSITVQRIKNDEGFTQAFSIVVDTADSMLRFQELVQRGTNLWPDATPEIKEFADRITNNLYGAEGAVMQDYKAQDTSIKKKCIHQYPTAINDAILLVVKRCIHCGQVKRN